jgi:hypothetical protein
MFDIHQAVEAAINRKTEADNAAWEEFQSRSRELLNGYLSRKSQKVLFGERAESLAQEALSQPLTPEQQEFELERLAEGLALQGDLESAVAFSPKRSEEYQAKLDAVLRDPIERCECSKRKNSWFLKEQIEYHNQIYSLYSCPHCNFTNAI